MGVYSRDNVDYQGMIQNMLANRARGAQIRSQGINRQGEIWGNAVSNIGNIASSTIRDMAAQEEAAKQQELENSWKQQQIDFQNRQLAQQKDLQLQQMALSRELQGAQATKEDELRKDEYMKDWQIANARLNAARAELDRNPNDPKLKAAVEEAEFNANYWRKKAGVQIPAPVVDVPAAPAETPAAPAETPLTNVDLSAKVNEILSRAEYNDAARDEANAVTEQIQDPKVKAEVQAKINAKGATKEDKAKAKAEADAKAKKKLDEANVAFSKMNSLDRRAYLKEHPEYKAVGGKLEFAKKK